MLKNKHFKTILNRFDKRNEIDIYEKQRNIKIDENILTFIDLFCGLGGFHIGMKSIVKVKSQCVMSCDINENVRTVYLNNFNILPEKDVKLINIKEHPRIDVVFFGWPCQPFSYSGKRMGLEDTRGTLFFDTMKIINESQPKFCIGENVKGVLSANNGMMYKEMKRITKEIGYKMFHILTNPEDIGIPQHRERYYFVFIRKDLYNQDIEQNILTNYSLFVEKEYIKNENIKILEDNVDKKYYIDEKLKNIITIWGELLKQLEGEKYTYIDLNLVTLSPSNDFSENKNKQIEKMLKIIDEKGDIIIEWIKKYPIIVDTDVPNTWRKLEWTAGECFTKDLNIWNYNIHIRQSGIRIKRNNVSPTLTKSGKPIIIGKLGRYLTPIECSRLQSYPSTYKFLSDNITYQQLGNSVNVDVVKIVLKSVMYGLGYIDNINILNKLINSINKLKI